ncbi:MAG: bifunctional oligoribonuclease/PAP phosphatase NrnA [Thermotogota bacterium]|nr:bifunctional oligoribonuclease/PAP phosphatase NrnA [Thermotogota bacterium]
MRPINALVSEIHDYENILICGHIMPDGDCISSVLTLTLALEKIGKQVIPAIDWEIPSMYYKLHDVDKITKFNRALPEVDLMIVVDASSPDRIGRFQKYLKNDTRTAVIDHHKTNTYFGDISWVDTKYSSTAQMIFELIQLLDINYDKKMANLNYLGIATDTGFFRYSNVDHKVFQTAAALTKKGADPTEIAQIIMESRKLEELHLFREALENMVCEGQLAYSFLDHNAFSKYGMSENEFGGFVGELRSLDQVEVAMFATESEPGEAHFSLRSKRFFDVSTIAEHFGGGGHPKAAGFSYRYENSDLREVTEEIANYIKEYLDN